MVMRLLNFCPETALFRNLGVNLRIFLCGVKVYASAQTLDFLDLTKSGWFPNQKRTASPSRWTRCSSLLLLLLLISPTLCLAAQLEAIPDRTRVGLEESFSLELRASGSVDGDPDLSVLEQDFELLGRSQSSQMQIINTDITRTTTWSLSLLARSAGRKTIPAICVEDDCSKPVIIDVLPAGQSSHGVSEENDLLLEVSTEPAKVWVQSQILYKVRLFTRLNFLQASLSGPEPQGVEAVVQKLGEDRNYETERDGLRYQVVERDYVIFPQQSGRLTIPPIQFGAQIAESGRRGYDPFNQRTRQLRKRSEEISIEVLPAADSGGRSWLPTSALQVKDDWQQPPQLTVGEPATRTITLRASGLPSAQLTPLSIKIPDGVRSYPDQPNREDQFNENGVIGILQQKLALVPTRPGTLQLPEVKIDWWDLKNERWQQALLPAIEVDVLPAANQPAVVATTPVEQSKTSQIEARPETERPPAATVVDPSFWPWLSLALGCAWILTLLFLVKGRRTGNIQNNAQQMQEKAPSLKVAQLELQQALKTGDQVQIRNALLGWGAALFPEQKPGNLEELAALCGESLKQQVEAFSRSLYSRNAEAWDGQELLEIVQQVERERTESTNSKKLPPLYPY